MFSFFSFPGIKMVLEVLFEIKAPASPCNLFDSHQPFPLPCSPLWGPEPIPVSGRETEVTLGHSVTFGVDLTLILCLDSKIGHISYS